MNSDSVKTREDFIKFLKYLEKDFQKDYDANKDKPFGGNGSWQNWTIGHYVESISAWMNDKGEFKSKKNLDWKDLAKIFEAGKYYE